jgi:hypothetical protein
MTNWRNEIRTCGCGARFTPKREKQRHCSVKCGTRVRVLQHRTRYRGSDLTALPEKPLQAPQPQSGGLADGPTMVWPEGDLHVGLPPGALQGDDVQLEYYEDGYPKLPACLDRRRHRNHLRRRHEAPLNPDQRRNDLEANKYRHADQDEQKDARPKACARSFTPPGVRLSFPVHWAS